MNTNSIVHQTQKAVCVCVCVPCGSRKPCITLSLYKFVPLEGMGMATVLHLVAKYVQELAFSVIAMADGDDGPPLSLQQLSAFHCVYSAHSLSGQSEWVLGRLVIAGMLCIASVTGYFRNIWATCDTGDPLNIHSEVPVYINSTGLRSIGPVCCVWDAAWCSPIELIESVPVGLFFRGMTQQHWSNGSISDDSLQSIEDLQFNLNRFSCVKLYEMENRICNAGAWWFCLI